MPAASSLAGDASETSGATQTEEPASTEPTGSDIRTGGCQDEASEALVISCSLESVRSNAEAVGIDVDDLQAGITNGTYSKNDVDAALSSAGIDAGDLDGFRSEVSSETACNDPSEEVYQLRCILAEALPGSISQSDQDFILTSYLEGVFTKVDVAFMIQESREEPDGRDVRYRDYDFFEGVEITDHLTLDEVQQDFADPNN